MAVVRASVVLLWAALALPGWPANATDQALQAALQRLNCVPARIETIQLAATVVAYEVTCKGVQQVITIVCVQNDCRLQKSAPDEEL